MSAPNITEDPLKKYYAEENEQDLQDATEITQEDPLAQYYENAPAQNQYRDVVSDELRQLGYEPDASEEFERAADFGTAEATRGTISGATLGLSEKIPGLEVGDNIAGEGGKFIGSFLPITRLMKFFNYGTSKLASPLIKLAQKSPVLQKQLSSLTSLLGVGAAGGTYGAAHEAIEKGKLPSVQDFLDHGAEWMLLDGAFKILGTGAKFTSSLFQKAEATNKPAWKVVNDTINEMKKDGVDFSNPERVQAKALSILEEPVEGAKPLSDRNINQPLKEQRETLENKVNELQNTKVSPNTLKPLTGEASELAEPYVPGKFDAIEIAEENASRQIDETLDTISERAPTEKQFGENVKADLESNLKQAQKEYRPAYELVDEAAANIFTTPISIAEKGFETLEALNAIDTKPEGFKKVIKTIETALKDAGFALRKENGILQEIVSEREVPVKKLTELGRRLNEIADFDVEGSYSQKLLKDFIREVKSSAKEGLKSYPEAKELFEQAEKKYAETAVKFGRDSIRKIRNMEASERVAKIVRSPTALADLKEVTSEKQFNQIQRELLDYMKGLSESRATALLREIRPSLTTDAELAAEEIIQSKISSESPNRKQRIYNQIQDTLFNDLAKSATTGERPKAALNLWKTKEGQQLIKNALKDNPNKNQILDYLTKQSFFDFSSSFVEADGSINFKKLRELMKDPATLENIKMLGGEEAVSFFKNLEKISKNIEESVQTLEELGPTRPTLTKKILTGKDVVRDRAEANASRIIKGKERLQKAAEKSAPWSVKVNKFFKDLDPDTKKVLTLLGIANAKTVGSVFAVYKSIEKIAKNKKIRDAAKKAAAHKNNPAYLMTLINVIEASQEKD